MAKRLTTTEIINDYESLTLEIKEQNKQLEALQAKRAKTVAKRSQRRNQLNKHLTAAVMKKWKLFSAAQLLSVNLPNYVSAVNTSSLWITISDFVIYRRSADTIFVNLENVTIEDVLKGSFKIVGDNPSIQTVHNLSFVPITIGEQLLEEV